MSIHQQDESGRFEILRPTEESGMSYRKQAFILRTVIYLVLTTAVAGAGLICHASGCIGKYPPPPVKMGR